MTDDFLFRVCSKFSPFYTTVINVVFWTVSIVPAAFTVWGVQGVRTSEESQESGLEKIAEEQVVGEKGNEAKV